MTWRWVRFLSREVLRGGEALLPLSFFLLGLAVVFAFAAVFNAEWVYTDPHRNSTLYGPNVTAVYNGLFTQCVDGCRQTGDGPQVCADGQCFTLDYLALGPWATPDCYQALQGTYGAVSGLIFAGIAMCFLTGFLVWYRLRRLQRKPHRYRRDRRRSAFAGFVTFVLFLVAFILFLTSQGNTYLCERPYDDQGSFGAPPFFIIAAAVFTGIVAALLWFPDYRPTDPAEVERTVQMVEGETHRSGGEAGRRPSVSPPIPPPAGADAEKSAEWGIPDPESGFFAGEDGGALPPPRSTPPEGRPSVFARLLENHPQLKRMGAFFFGETQERLKRLEVERECFREMDSMFVRVDAEGKILRDLHFDAFRAMGKKAANDSIPEPLEVQDSPAVPIIDVIEPTMVPPRSRAAPRSYVGPRPTLGIEIKIEDGDTPDTALVIAHRLAADGPAETAGVEPGDILTSWNGKLLQSKQVFARCLKNSAIGELVTLGLMRNGVYLEVGVEIGGVAPPQ